MSLIILFFVVTFSIIGFGYAVYNDIKRNERFLNKVNSKE